MMHKIQRRFAHRWQCIEADQQVHKKGKNGKGIQLHQVDKNEKKRREKIIQIKRHKEASKGREGKGQDSREQKKVMRSQAHRKAKRGSKGHCLSSKPPIKPIFLPLPKFQHANGFKPISGVIRSKDHIDMISKLREIDLDISKIGWFCSSHGNVWKKELMVRFSKALRYPQIMWIIVQLKKKVAFKSNC